MASRNVGFSHSGLYVGCWKPSKKAHGTITDFGGIGAPTTLTASRLVTKTTFISYSIFKGTGFPRVLDFQGFAGFLRSLSYLS